MMTMPFDSGVCVVRADTGWNAFPDGRADTGMFCVSRWAGRHEVFCVSRCAGRHGGLPLRLNV